MAFWYDRCLADCVIDDEWRSEMVSTHFLCAVPCRGNMPLRRRTGCAASSGEGHSSTRLHTGAPRKNVSKSWWVPGV